MYDVCHNRMMPRCVSVIRMLFTNNFILNHIINSTTGS